MPRIFPKLDFDLLYTLHAPQCDLSTADELADFGAGESARGGRDLYRYSPAVLQRRQWGIPRRGYVRGQRVRMASDVNGHGTPISTCQLPLSGTCVGGVYYSAPTGSYPPRNVSFMVAPVGIKQMEYAIALESQLSLGATSTCWLKDEDASAFAAYDNNLTILMTPPGISGVWRWLMRRLVGGSVTAGAPGHQQ